MFAFLGWFFTVGIPIVLIVSAFTTGMRLYLRCKIRGFRERRYVGDLIWVELIPEYVKQETGANERTEQQRQFNQIFTFASSMTAAWPYWDRGTISFVWSRDEEGIWHLYAGHSDSKDDLAIFKSLASGINSRIERLSEPPDVPSQNVFIATRDRGTPSVIETQPHSGAVIERLSAMMEHVDPNERVALVATLDYMRNSESKRIEGYLNEQGIMRGGEATKLVNTAKESRVVADQAVRMSIVGTSSHSPEVARSIIQQSVDSMSTLGWRTKIKSLFGVSTSSSVFMSAIAMAWIALLGWKGGIDTWLWPILMVAALGTIILVRTKGDQLNRQAVAQYIHKGEIPVSPFLWFSPRWRLHGSWMAQRRNAGGNELVENVVAPPSDKSVLYLHHKAAYELLTFPPVSDTETKIIRDVIQSKGLPSEFLNVTTPIYFGKSGKDQYICQDLDDSKYSLYTAGGPGSGKTNFLQVIYAGMVKESLKPNATITPIWGETKGEGAYTAWDIAKHNPNAIFIDAHNPDSLYRLALEGKRLSDGVSVDSVIDNAELLTGAMQFAWGDGIMASAKDIIDSTLKVALLLSPEEIRAIGLAELVDADKPNIIDLSFFILGGDYRVSPAEKLLELADDLDGIDQRESVLKMTVGSLSRYISPRTKRQFEHLIGSPLNKLAELRNVPHLWQPDHRTNQDINLDLLKSFVPVVINVGPYTLPDGSFSKNISPSVSRRVLLIFNYILWNQIKAYCSGWLDQGYRIPLFFDEVRNVAVDSRSDDETANVLKDGLAEGRSKGLAYFIGCQSPSQMPISAAKAVLGSRSKFWFNLHEPDDLKLAQDDLSSSDRESIVFDTSTIRNQPDGHSIGMMSINGKITPPFGIRVPYAPKWGEILMQEDVTVEDAIIEYSEWEERQRLERIEA